MSTNNKRKYGEYYLGLDIGTNSIGWAVTDPEYNVLKFGKKPLWGVRLFEDAKTAAERRIYRVARRRIERRHQRIGLLRELFENEIAKIDPEFFRRMDEGALHWEDKTVRGKANLFLGDTYNDKAYHKQYPTIYHLRDELIRSTEPHDARLVYLALHHMLKKRGHFLFEGEMDRVPELKSVLENFAQEVENALGEEDGAPIGFSSDHWDEMAAILCDANKNATAKLKALRNLFGFSQRSVAEEMCRAMTGGAVQLRKIFTDLAEDGEDIKIDFKSDKYEETVLQAAEMLGDADRMLILEKMKAVYDWSRMANILSGGDPSVQTRYLSSAMAARYDRHGEDLKLLKRVVRRCRPDAYDDLFKAPDVEGNYCAYSGMAMKNGRKLPIKKQCDRDKFYSYVKKCLGKPKDAEAEEILSRIEAGRFMPKMSTRDNGVIPNQIHCIEMKRILENAAGYLPFLAEKDADGLTPADKILQILRFRIPYYVGPLNNLDPHRQNTWVERRSQEKIYPWNFEQVVDLEKSGEKFIARMTAECTYLRGCGVLPKDSVLYSKYMVLNELNNLKINGEEIDVGLKQRVYNDLFMSCNRVTAKRLKQYLKHQGTDVENMSITGIDGDFKASLQSERKLRGVLGEWYTDERAETVIKAAAIFGDDRKILTSRLTAELGGELPADVIKKAAALRFKGWGRLSREFLTEIRDDRNEDGMGGYRNIIDALWHTNRNLMQLLGYEYGFNEAVVRFNREREGERGFQYDAVRDLYVSPAVKRQIWQTMLVVKELRKVMGHDPRKVFIEMAREKGEKKRTESRKNALRKLYDAIRTDAEAFAAADLNAAEMSALRGRLENEEDNRLRRDKLYLYYTQMGKCMYTGKPIDITRLDEEGLYDIDHIFPRSKVKDDSLDNRVLVVAQSNRAKTDVYPIEARVRNARHPFWKMLKEKGLISAKKYERLTRATPLSTDELSSFIARQLVETRQSTKAVADMLRSMMESTAVVYVKAGLVSEFRQDYDFVKCREVNDLHHAKDAYLNIVVGNVYHTKFTSDPRNFFRERDQKYSLNAMYRYRVERGGVTAWVPVPEKGSNGGTKEKCTIVTVCGVMNKNHPLVSRMVYDTHGELFDVQPKKKGQWQLPLKGDARLRDGTKYGGYGSVKGTYFMLVEHTEKKKRERSIVYMPLHRVGAIRDDGQMLAMLENEHSLVDPKVLIPHIGIDSVIEVDGFRMYLTGRTNNDLLYAPAHQLILGNKKEKYLKKVLKFRARAAEYKKTHKNEELSCTVFDGIAEEDNVALYDAFLAKLGLPMYMVRLSKQKDDLTLARGAFEALTREKQCEVLSEMLNLFTCNRVTADLRELDLAGRAGTIKTSAQVSKYHSAYLIHHSVTGLFEQRVDLLK